MPNMSITVINKIKLAAANTMYFANSGFIFTVLNAIQNLSLQISPILLSSFGSQMVHFSLKIDVGRITAGKAFHGKGIICIFAENQDGNDRMPRK